MFQVHNNWNNEISFLNKIFHKGQRQTVLFAYETDNNIGYYTIFVDIELQMFVICQNNQIKAPNELYNEKKFYFSEYQQVKQFLSQVITNNFMVI